MSTSSLPTCVNKNISSFRQYWWRIEDKIDNFLCKNNFYWLHWKIRDAIFYIKHRILQSHLIDTKLPKGKWTDKTSLMEAGLLELIDSFVSRDGEDAFTVCKWDHNECHEDAKFKIIEILYWKCIKQPLLESQKENLWREYHNKYPIYFKRLEGTNLSEMLHENDSEERIKELKEVVVFEEMIDAERQRILHLCVDVREFLWT